MWIKYFCKLKWESLKNRIPTFYGARKTFFFTDEEPATDDSPSKPPEGRRLSFVEMAKKVRSKVAIAALAMPKSKKSAPFGASKDQSGAGIAGAASMASMIKSKLLGEEDDDDDDDDDEKKEEADSGDEIVVDQGEGSEGEPAKQSNKEVTLDDIRK